MKRVARTDLGEVEQRLRLAYDLQGPLGLQYDAGEPITPVVVVGDLQDEGYYGPTQRGRRFGIGYRIAANAAGENFTILNPATSPVSAVIDQASMWASATAEIRVFVGSPLDTPSATPADAVRFVDRPVSSADASPLLAVGNNVAQVGVQPFIAALGAVGNGVPTIYAPRCVLAPGCWLSIYCATNAIFSVSVSGRIF